MDTVKSRCRWKMVASPPHEAGSTLVVYGDLSSVDAAVELGPTHPGATDHIEPASREQVALLGTTRVDRGQSERNCCKWDQNDTLDPF